MNHPTMTQLYKEWNLHQQTSLQPTQPAQLVITTRGDETTSQEQPQVQPPTEHQPDQPVTTAYNNSSPNSSD